MLQADTWMHQPSCFVEARLSHALGKSSLERYIKFISSASTAPNHAEDDEIRCDGYSMSEETLTSN